MSIRSFLPRLARLSLLCPAALACMAAYVELPQRAPIPQWRGELRPQQPAARPEARVFRNLPAAEVACRAALRALGVTFAIAPPVKAKGGCSIAFPLEVTALSPEIRLHPPALLNCRTARAAAQLFQRAGMAAARKHFKAGISTVTHGSAYVCRPINGQANLSEHAFGNALDILGISLSDGREVIVHEYQDGKGAEASFLRELRAAACGTFSTVLGPGTNADHADHFHFDMKKRRNPYCR